MNPLERILVGLVFDIKPNRDVSTGTPSAQILTNFVQSFAEHPLLSASSDLFIGLCEGPATSVSDVESDLWRKHVRKLVQGSQMMDVASALCEAMLARSAALVGGGIPVCAQWALLLSNSIQKQAFGTKTPEWAAAFGPSLVPVMISAQSAKSQNIWGVDALEVPPELLPHFLGDVIDELQRQLWAVRSASEIDGKRFQRWAVGVERTIVDTTTDYRAGADHDVKLDPKIDISVRGGWRPVE